MKTYQLKPETVEKMRAVAMPSRYRARPGGSDILARRMADEHARVAAEHARDNWAENEVEFQIENAHDEARDAIGRFHILKAEVRGNLNAPVYYLVLRELRAMRALVRESMRRVRELREYPGIVWRD